GRRKGRERRRARIAAGLPCSHRKPEELPLAGGTLPAQAETPAAAPRLTVNAQRQLADAAPVDAKRRERIGADRDPARTCTAKFPLPIQFRAGFTAQRNLPLRVDGDERVGHALRNERDAGTLQGRAGPKRLTW